MTTADIFCSIDINLSCCFFRLIECNLPHVHALHGLALQNFGMAEQLKWSLPSQPAPA